MKTISLILMNLLSTLAMARTAGQAEKILGYLPSQKGITFQVASGGCTQKNDFVAEIQKDPSDGLTKLTLLRTRPDNCFPFLPMGERVEFRYEELGIRPSEDFVIQNANGTVQAWAYDFPEFRNEAAR